MRQGTSKIATALRLACCLCAVMKLQSEAHAHQIKTSDPLNITMYLVTADVLCKAPDFNECIDVKKFGIDRVQNMLFDNDKSPVEFNVPPSGIGINLTSSDSARSLLLAVTAYVKRYRKLHGRLSALAAVFVVHLTKGQKRVVSFRHKRPGKPWENSRIVQTPGRYVTWFNALDVYPYANIRFQLIVSGTIYRFRFI